MAKHIEDDHQKALFDWMSHQHHGRAHLNPVGKTVRDFAFAIPNGGKRNAREAARMKGQGVTDGIPDLMIGIPVNGYAGLFIEMKRPLVKGQTKPKLSASQREKLVRFNRAGYLGVVCYGWMQARELIRCYLNTAKDVHFYERIHEFHVIDE